MLQAAPLKALFIQACLCYFGIVGRRMRFCKGVAKGQMEERTGSPPGFPEGHAKPTALVRFGPFLLEPARRLLTRDGSPVGLSSRALDILSELTAAPGEILSKVQLLERVWPGVVVDEGALRFHVAALRKALGDGQDGARYIATIAGRGYCFVGGEEPVAAGRGEAAFVVPRLPRQLQEMHGREVDLEAVSECLREASVVTIIGPGGIGKTTLAVAVAHQLAARYDPIAFLDLSGTADPRLVPAMLGQALGLDSPGSDPLGRAAEHISGRDALVLLDSCEHLIETVASLAQQLVELAPGVRILATSRELLRLDVERVYQLAPLALPCPDDDSEEGMHAAATQLFLRRAAATGAKLSMQPSERALIGTICRRLDGIPLALELAATAVVIYGLKGVADLLGSHFHQLSNGRRSALPRHQTLMATLDWSYDLLSDVERSLFRRLSIFVGGFDIEGAKAIGGVTGVDVLIDLVCKSLVATDTGASGPRFRMLDTTRAYAALKLAETGEASAIARAHAEYYLARLEAETTAEPEVMRAQLANVTAALHWCFGAEGDRDLGFALAAAAAPSWVQLGMHGESRIWAQRAFKDMSVRQRGGPGELALRFAYATAVMGAQGHTETSIAALDGVVELAAELGRADDEFRALNALQLCYASTGDLRSAQVYRDRCAALIASGRVAEELRILFLLGEINLLYMKGEHAAVEALIPEVSAPPSGQNFAASSQYWSTRNIAALNLWFVGDPIGAWALAERIVAETAAGHPPEVRVQALTGYVYLQLLSGRDEAAAEVLGEMTELTRRFTLGPYAAIADAFGALLEPSLGGTDAAARLEGALATLRLRRVESLTSYFSLALAQSLLASGRTAAALALVRERTAHMQAQGERLFLPEALRIQALIQLREGDRAAAETALGEALQLAEAQGAAPWTEKCRRALAELDEEGACVPASDLVLAAPGT
jgi:predicted ATPase/DNA-binding winged helix-turn-helix (wHTH) protein